MTKSLVLASASPRRAELLQQMGVHFSKSPVDLDESVMPGESPETYVQRLAQEKALACWQHQPEKVVLGSDTTVVVQNKIFGKPENQQQAFDMLGQLSGQWHDVLTAVCIVAAGEQGQEAPVLHQAMSQTRVKFKLLTPERIEQYWLTGEPIGKAGAYAIQGFGGVLVERIEGSYTGVVGLPVSETESLLAQVGIPCWQKPL